MRAGPPSSPGPQYYPRHHQSEVGGTPNISASFASASARTVLPNNPMHSIVPGPSKYSPRSSADFRGRGGGPTKPKSGVAVQGASALGYTSPRFTKGHYNHTRHEVPGPGAYNAGDADPRTLGVSTSQHALRSGFSAATEARRVDDFWHIRNTPGAAHYEPQSSARGIGDLPPERKATPSAAFASGSHRLRAQQTLSPGPGGYAPYDGKATASAIERPRQALMRSASFGSTSRRFTPNTPRTPGPGAYHEGLASPRGSRMSGTPNISASFASASARTVLPNNPMHSIVPGPGGYEHTNPVSDYARPLRRSASFSSASERLRTPRQTAPPPGAYNPQMSSRGRALSGATQRYSVKRVGS